MKSLAYILLSTGFTAASILACGALLIRRLRLELDRSEHLFYGFLLGSAMLSLIVFGLAAAGLIYKGTILATGLTVFAICWQQKAYRLPPATLPPLSRFWWTLFLSVYAIYGLLYLSNALAPEASSDGTAYHLALPASYYRDHGFTRITDNMYASLSQGVELLFLYAFAFGKHSAATLVHYLFLMALPWGMLACARRAGSPVAGVLGSLLVFASPIAGQIGTIAYIDVAVATIVFGSFGLLLIWREQRNPKLLVAAGMLAGFAYGCKYTAFLAVPYAVGFVLWTCWRNRLPVGRPLLLVSASAAILIAPWLIKNTIVIGNPFAPFANRFFPNPYVYISFEKMFLRSQGHINGLTLSEIPLQLTLYGDRIEGLIGAVFLLLPFTLLAVRRPWTRQLLLAALVYSLPYFSNISARFLLTVLPFAALALGDLVARQQQLAAMLVLAHALTSWPSVLHRYIAPHAWGLQGSQWRAALRLEDERDYLQSHLGDYRIGLILDKLIPNGERILSPNTIQQAYHRHEVVVAYASAFGNRMNDTLWGAMFDHLMPTWQHQYRFEPRTVRHLRLVQTGTSDTDNWSISEIQLFSNGVQIPRTSAWKLASSLNPWDAPLAADRNLASFWNSRDAFHPGAWLTLNLGQDQQIDELRILCSHNQGASRMRLEIGNEAGHWQPLANEAALSDIAPPPDLRRQATAYLKASGIHWFLIHDDEMKAQDYRERAAEWGMKQVAIDGGFRLYRLE